MLKLDHLAMACETLEEGRAVVEEALGVKLQEGGQHAKFGTHNLLLGLEGGLYFEVIAVDPEGQTPDRPRWFGLDEFSDPPRLSNWICAVDDIALAPSAAGAPVALERGDLRWQMAVPANGMLPYDQCFPAFIQWQGALHPAPMLVPSGVALRKLLVQHPRANELHREVMITDARVHFEAADKPALIAEFDTPNGIRTLA